MNTTATSKPTDHQLSTGRARTQYINWTSPLIWTQIERTAQAVGPPWSPAEIVRRLKQLDPIVFDSLRPQRISQWRDQRFPGILRWTESHMRSIEAGNRPSRANAGRNGVLVSFIHI